MRTREKEERRRRRRRRECERERDRDRERERERESAEDGGRASGGLRLACQSGRGSVGLGGVSVAGSLHPSRSAGVSPILNASRAGRADSYGAHTRSLGWLTTHTLCIHITRRERRQRERERERDGERKRRRGRLRKEEGGMIE